MPQEENLKMLVRLQNGISGIINNGYIVMTSQTLQQGLHVRVEVAALLQSRAEPRGQHARPHPLKQTLLAVQLERGVKERVTEGGSCLMPGARCLGGREGGTEV